MGVGPGVWVEVQVEVEMQRGWGEVVEEGAGSTKGGEQRGGQRAV